MPATAAATGATGAAEGATQQPPTIELLATCELRTASATEDCT